MVFSRPLAVVLRFGGRVQTSLLELMEQWRSAGVGVACVDPAAAVAAAVARTRTTATPKVIIVRSRTGQQK